MNRLLLIAGLVLAASSAGAVEIPKEFRGSWCEAVATDEVRYSRNPSPQENCETYDSGMTVTVSGYTGHKAECMAIKVSRRRNHYRIEFTCQTDWPDDVLVPLDKRQVWQLDGGDLVIK